jgi:hypothetical protein
LAFALALSAFSGVAYGWQLTITGQNHVWNLADPSPTHVVGIENPTNSTDPLFAWSLGLTITPDISATGTLEFATATPPSDYLLDGRSGGLAPTFSGPAASIAPIGDTDSLFTGIIVPETGKNLLATTFTTSPDALGVFYISAVPDEFTGSNWFSSDFENVRYFENVPLTGGPVVIGSITVVPEPGTLTMVLSASGLICLWTLRRRCCNCTQEDSTAPRRGIVAPTLRTTYNSANRVMSTLC